MDCHYSLAKTTNQMVASDICTVLYIATYPLYQCGQSFFVERVLVIHLAVVCLYVCASNICVCLFRVNVYHSSRFYCTFGSVVAAAWVVNSKGRKADKQG